MESNVCKLLSNGSEENIYVEIENKYMQMVNDKANDESGYKGYHNALYYSCNLSVSLKLYES